MLLLLLELSDAGVGVEEGVERDVMMEIIVVATPAELEVTWEAVVMSVRGVSEEDGEVLDGVEVELIVTGPFVEEELEDVEDRVAEVGGEVLEMEAMMAPPSPRFSVSASSLSQQLFLGSRLLSQHHEPSEHH